MYKLLSHTADISILARADSIEKLFESALEGLCNVLYNDLSEIKKSFKVESSEILISVETESYDKSSLLIDFLSSCLTQMHLHNAVIFNIQTITISNNSIFAIIAGSKVNSFDNDVKAVTYYDANIKTSDDDFFEVIITLDI